MAKYTVFESVNMRSTHFAERIFDAVSDTDIENGTFGYLDGIADGESVIYNFKPGFKAGEPVVVVDNPAWDADTSKRSNQRRDKYINEAGVPFRVRVLKLTDEFGITIEGMTASTKKTVTDVTDFVETPVYLTIDATGKLKAATSKASDAIFEAQIMRKRLSGATLATSQHTYGYSTAIYEAKVVALQ